MQQNTSELIDLARKRNDALVRELADALGAAERKLAAAREALKLIAAEGIGQARDDAVEALVQIGGDDDAEIA